MTDRLIRAGVGSRLAAGLDGERAWLELTPREGEPGTVEFSAGEPLMAIEALTMVYAERVGANPASFARGVSRTLGQPRPGGFPRTPPPERSADAA